MSSTTSTTAESDCDHRLHEAILHSTKQIVGSQQAAMEALICKLIESQAHNHAQMLEMLTSIFNKGLSELNHQNVSLASVANNHKEEAVQVVENGLADDDNKQQENDDQVNENAPVFVFETTKFFPKVPRKHRKYKKNNRKRDYMSLNFSHLQTKSPNEKTLSSLYIEGDETQVNEEAPLEDGQVTRGINEDTQVNEEAPVEDGQVTHEINDDSQVNEEAPVEDGQVTHEITGQVTQEIAEEDHDQVNEDAPVEDGQVTHEITEEDDDQVNEDAPVEDGQVTHDVTEESICNFDGLESLWEAVQANDWETAIRYVKNNQTTIEELFRGRNSEKEIGKIFAAAIVEGQWKLVEEIAKLAPPKALERRNAPNGYTILHLAAAYGNIKIVKVLVNRNPYLTQIRTSLGTGGLVPLTLSALSATDDQKEILEYLYPITRDYTSQVARGDGYPGPFSNGDGALLVIALVEADLYGMALSICRQFPYLLMQMVATTEGEYCLLQKIVERPFAFLSGANLTWWERSIYSLIEVNMDCPHDYAIIVRDEENPPETSNGSAVAEGCFMTSYKGNITRHISVYLRRYLMLVPHVKQLYNKKLMHKEAVALVKSGLTCLHETTNQVQRQNYFSNSSIMTTAIKYGTTEFVLECLRKFQILSYHPTLSLKISKMVIEERNVDMFNYICQQNQKLKRDRLSFSDENKNTILHYAATLASTRQLSSVPGAAFQVQRQMQWFKGVERIVLQKDRFVRNRDGHTAQFLFTENHRDLMGKGETWMKDTSGSCMLVGALIATVAFAAALTVPGGNVSDSNSSNTVTPVFLQQKSFMVFAIADALALFSSVTSVLMFLAIYTSRYSEEDFLKSLPRKMILGLATLFVSMATILVSFGAAFTIVLGRRFSWAPIAVALFGCVPVFLFGFLQFPFFVGMVQSTFLANSLLEAKASHC